VVGTKEGKSNIIAPCKVLRVGEILHRKVNRTNLGPISGNVSNALRGLTKEAVEWFTKLKKFHYLNAAQSSFYTP
jgi:hypothetical protein